MVEYPLDVIERFGADGVSGRELSVLELPDPGSLPESLEVPGPHFICLVACDAGAYSAEELGTFAERLLEAGAVFICTSGPDCERLHDIFDEEIVGGDSEEPRFPISIMTTWHEDSLDEAIWFFLYTAFPDDEFWDTCRCALAISIGNPAWAASIRRALSDPSKFSRRVLNQ